MTSEQMKKILLNAFENPENKNIFYSFDGNANGSEKLASLPYFDWTPQKSHQVKGNNTCVFPLGMGCKQIEINNGEEWAEALFTEDELLTSQHLDIPNTDIFQHKTGVLLNTVKEMVNTIPQGDIIRGIDIQSPLGVAEVMCGAGLYTALLVNPTAIHNLLERITEFIINFIKELKIVAGEKLNGCMFPFIWSDQKGTLCSDDTLSLLSPEMHKEFSLPYIQKIAQACGPLYYHSCTWSEEYFDNIKSLEPVRTFNWNTGNTINPHTIIQEFSGRAVLAPHIGRDTHTTDDAQKWGIFKNTIELLDYIISGMQNNASLYMWIDAGTFSTNELEEIYDYFYAKGLTPSQY